MVPIPFVSVINKEVGSPPVFFTTEQNTTVSSFYRTVTRGALVSRSKVRVLVQQI